MFELNLIPITYESNRLVCCCNMFPTSLGSAAAKGSLEGFTVAELNTDNQYLVGHDDYLYVYVC